MFLWLPCIYTNWNVLWLDSCLCNCWLPLNHAKVNISPPYSGYAGCTITQVLVQTKAWPSSAESFCSILLNLLFTRLTLTCCKMLWLLLGRLDLKFHWDLEAMAVHVHRMANRRISGALARSHIVSYNLATADYCLCKTEIFIVKEFYIASML